MGAIWGAVSPVFFMLGMGSGFAYVERGLGSMATIKLLAYLSLPFSIVVSLFQLLSVSARMGGYMDMIAWVLAVVVGAISGVIVAIIVTLLLRLVTRVVRSDVKR